ncbi:MAG: hypothetical protein GWP10_21620 [Nitrospiraceae bacterium]|nr:hypothetical protein [Nitrospiraceae bacterium]
MKYSKIFENLFLNPIPLFKELKHRNVSVADLIVAAIVVIISSMTNIAPVLYFKRSVASSFVLYTVLIAISMWLFFAIIVHIVANIFSTKKYKKFMNTLFGVGISRLPVIVFVCLQFIVLITRKVNIISTPFLMIYILVILWMFYLYTTGIEEFYGISIGKSVFVIVVSFVLILLLLTFINKAINVKIIYF